MFFYFEFDINDDVFVLVFVCVMILVVCVDGYIDDVECGCIIGKIFVVGFDLDVEVFLESEFLCFVDLDGFIVVVKMEE